MYELKRMTWTFFTTINAWLLCYLWQQQKYKLKGYTFSEFAQERSTLLANNAKLNQYKQDGLCSYKLFWTDIIINCAIVPHSSELNNNNFQLFCSTKGGGTVKKIRMSIFPEKKKKQAVFLAPWLTQITAGVQRVICSIIVPVVQRLVGLL